MTRLSPPIVYQCPACAGYLARHVFVSLFMDGLDHWSDGRTSAFWHARHDPIARCPRCRAVFWWDDARQIAALPSRPYPIDPITRALIWLTGDRRGRLRERRQWQAIPSELNNVESGDNPDYPDLCFALAQLAPDARDREIYLRHRIWWKASDHLRHSKRTAGIAPQPAMPAADALANSLRLLELFEHDPARQVERGELLRQLSRFDEAVAVLKAVKPDGYSEVRAVKIERLARECIAELRLLS